jgi:hypothetical protein
MMEEKWKIYGFEYPYKGSKWLLEIKAPSREDAEARFKALPWGKYQGERILRVPIPAGSFILRLWRFLRGDNG